VEGGGDITFIYTCKSHFVAMLHFKQDIFPEFCELNAVKHVKNNTVNYAMSRIWLGCYIRTVASDPSISWKGIR